MKSLYTILFLFVLAFNCIEALGQACETPYHFDTWETNSYTAGDQASYSGRNYTCNPLGSQGFRCNTNGGHGANPSVSDQWTDNGVCSNCSAPSAGSIGGTQSICSPGDPTAITNTTDGGGTSWEWQYSPNGSTGWTTIGGATLSSYDPPAGLTADRWYRRRSVKCTPDLFSSYTSSIKVTVTAVPTITGTTPATRCGTGTVNLGATASAGTINWYTASSGGASQGTGTSFTTPSIPSTTTYYADATDAGCVTASRTAVTATVDPTTVGGTIAAAATECYGDNGATLTLSGHTGSIVEWQSSTDNWTTTNVIANTSTTQAYSNLTLTTKYKAVVKSGSCASADSGVITITVHPAIVPGSIEW